LTLHDARPIYPHYLCRIVPFLARRCYGKPVDGSRYPLSVCLAQRRDLGIDGKELAEGFYQSARIEVAEQLPHHPRPSRLPLTPDELPDVAVGQQVDDDRLAGPPV